MSSVLNKVNVVSIDTSKSRQQKPLDEELIEQFILGSRVAFDLLVKRYKKRMFGFICFQLKGQLEDAEDLCQEVFIQLYQKPDNFRHQSTFSTYLFSIARNIVLNYVRTKSRRPQSSVDLSNEEVLSGEPVNDCPDNNDMTKYYNLALSSLSVDERQILFLCDKEAFTYAQISEILAINLGTVRSRINTARNKMIGQLKEKFDEML
ncbi:RNA polymerase sigma factor [Colwellia sp. D2M02]|uniref:RNA polymerase sigma factor n=1 Tax=Colwellia sp. D2M02 TaxID=2841562 RepID=UPI001C0A13F1|nr:RNA polymerase sigma factor [Colwellia sp. D2M02]MBU2893184.1 RNA polymerase sigma factor [Colwellia sp. D2M02]